MAAVRVKARDLASLMPSFKSFRYREQGNCTGAS